MRDLALKIFAWSVLLIGGGGWFVAVVWAVWDYFVVAQAWWHYVLILIFAMVLPFWYAVVCWAHDGFLNTYTLLVCVSGFCCLILRAFRPIKRPNLDKWALQLALNNPEISVDSVLDAYINQFDYKIQKYKNETEESIILRTKIDLIENSLFYNPEYNDQKGLSQYFTSMKMALAMFDKIHKPSEPQ